MVEGTLWIEFAELAVGAGTVGTTVLGAGNGRTAGVSAGVIGAGVTGRSIRGIVGFIVGGAGRDGGGSAGVLCANAAVVNIVRLPRKAASLWECFMGWAG